MRRTVPVAVRRYAAWNSRTKVLTHPNQDHLRSNRIMRSGRRPSWRSLLVGLGIALVMVSIMATTYVWANHALVAHHLPWGQVGSSPLTTAVTGTAALPPG